MPDHRSSSDCSQLMIVYVLITSTVITYKFVIKESQTQFDSPISYSVKDIVLSHGRRLAQAFFHLHIF
jgi:hypothetical protein